ncbi:MAG: hypothetical protein VB119_11305 [Candidatus Metalachnospira sp.]|nr:hypothetical protein [Candidatus Metalachnospira sp.]
MEEIITKDDIIKRLKEIAFSYSDEAKCSEKLKALEMLCKITGVMNETSGASEAMTLEEYLRNTEGR